MVPSVVQWFASSNVLVVAGKGGVGRTTVGATLGVAAARAGLDVLLVELEGASRLGPLFGYGPLTYDDVVLETTAGGGRLRGCQLSPGAALWDYLGAGTHRLGGRLARLGAVEVVAAATPGLRDLLVLGKVRQLEQQGAADLIVVDGPASGHALGLLGAPLALGRLAATGPLRHQADLVSELFSDGRRCQVVLVTLAEEGPVNEVVETAYAIEDQVGVTLGPVVVNSCWPEVPGLAEALSAGPGPATPTGGRRRQGTPRARAASNRRREPDREAHHLAARFRLARVADQTSQMERLRRELPLPQVRLPYLFTPTLARSDLDLLADAVTTSAPSADAAAVEPGLPVVSGRAAGRD